MDNRVSFKIWPEERRQPSSPLWGGVGGGGVSATLVQFSAHTPTLDPSPQGGGRGGRAHRRRTSQPLRIGAELVRREDVDPRHTPGDDGAGVSLPLAGRD